MTGRLGVAGAMVDGHYVDGDVSVAEGRVTGVGLTGPGRGVAVPGYIDLQVNGFAGIDLLRTDADGYDTVGRALLRTGVVAYQPTLITSAPADLIAALRVLSDVDVPSAGSCSGDVPTAAPRARVIGAHIEGPFLSPKRAGTHPVELLVEPDLSLIDRAFDVTERITMVTIAPELDGSAAVIERLRDAGVVVWAGHSGADAEQAHVAFDAGVSGVTHLFNAMAPLHHRRPGLVGAGLVRAGINLGIIGDGIHLAPDIVRLVHQAAGDRMILVTDAISATGRGDGSWSLGSVEVTVADGEARRADGTLAGSMLTMDVAVRNLLEWGVPFGDAINAATRNPAMAIGRPDLVDLTPGATADLLILDDDLGIEQVMVAGESVA